MGKVIIKKNFINTEKGKNEKQTYNTYVFQRSTYIFLPRGFPHIPIFWDLNNQDPKYADPSTIDASITCPTLLLVRSYNAMSIPKAHIKPPPPKSAVRLTGGVGFSLYRPNKDNNPINTIYII